MSKRKSINRLSRRYSKHKSTSSISSGVLDPDTNIIGDEKTFWWNNLEDGDTLGHSLMHDKLNETTKQLSLNSELGSNSSKTEWWKNLESLHDENNAGTSSNKNFSIGINRNNVMQSSSSDLEEEVRKKKLPLRKRNRKSINNSFVNALDDTNVSKPISSSQMKRTRSNDPHTNHSVSKVSRKSDDSLEDSENLTSSTKILKSKPKGLKRIAKNNVDNDDNVFQDVLAEDSILNNSAKRNSISKERSSNRLVHFDADTDEDQISHQVNIIKSPVKNITNATLNSSDTRDRGSVLQSDISHTDKTIQNTDDSGRSNKVLKPKTRFLQRARKSLGTNAFKDAFADDGNVTLVQDNLNQEIDSMKSPKKSLLDSPKTPTKNKMRDTHESPISRNTPIRRSSRLSFGKTSQNRSVNTSMQQIENTSKENLTNVSTDDNESRKINPLLLKKKSRFLSRLPNNSTDNLFEEIFGEVDNGNKSKDSSATLVKDIHIPLQKDEVKRRMKELRVSLINDKDVTLRRGTNRSINEKLSGDNSHKLTSLNNEKNTSVKVCKQLFEKTDSSSTDDGIDASKYLSPKEKRITTPSKQITSHSKLQESVPETSTKHTRTDTLLSNDDIYEPGSSNNISDDDLHDNANRGDERALQKQLQQLNKSKEASLISHSVSNQTEMPSTNSKNVIPLSRRSVPSDVDIEEEESISEELRVQDNISQTENHTRNLRGVSIAKSPSIDLLLNREVSRKQQSQSRLSNYHSTPIKASSNVSSNISRITSSKTARIDEFFNVNSSTVMNKQDNPYLPSRAFTDAKKIEKIKNELEKLKNREIAAMNIDNGDDMKKRSLKTRNAKSLGTALTKPTKKKTLFAKSEKVVNKAFMVNGQVYKAPRLCRPKHWATSRLYQFLWKCMEPKYKLATRLHSEKFMQELASMVSFIEKTKKYKNYKSELKALMKEMARLKIIHTPNDFYNFCRDFMPYEFRIKVIPTLMPGNQKLIPYNPETLHESILSNE